MTIAGHTVMAAPPSADLDQVRNGPAAAPNDPVDWVNGNAGGSNSHYLEGYSVPYRAVMENLPVDNGTTVIKITLAYDATHSGRHALDFLTHFERLDNPPHNSPVYFGHPPEPINPIDDLSGVDLKSVDENNFDLDDVTPSDTVAIPTPIAVPPDLEATLVAAFNKIPAGERVLTLYGGTFVTSYEGKSYPAYEDAEGNESRPDIENGQSEQMITIAFTADSPTAVLAWGGHIASRYDWGYDEQGLANSAGALSGSPYHMRTIDWNLNNLGNQDRSLSADAVLTLEECELVGDKDICQADGPHTYFVDTQSTSILWEIDSVLSTYPATSSGPYNEPYFTFDTPTSGGGTIILRVTVDVGEITQNTCEYMITVNPTPDCSITEPVVDKFISSTPYDFSAPAGMDSYFWVLEGDATFKDGVDNQQNVTVITDSVQSGYFVLTLNTSTGGCSNVCSTERRNFQDENEPEIDCPDGLTIECDESPHPDNTGYATATDNVGDPVITWSDETDFDECGNGTITRTWTATDSSDNTATCTQTITIVDTTAPVLSGVPTDSTVECDAIPDPANVTATDNCDSDPVVEFQESGSVVCGSGTITRTWTATDCADNSVSATQTITVVDTTKPVLIGVPANTTVECDAIPGPAIVSGADNCDPSPVIGYQESSTVDCGEGTITRTWTATDCAGNMISATQTITVQDTTAPVLSGVPGEITVECNSIPAAATVSASDNCDTEPTLDYSQTGSLTCGNGVLIRTWTATDCAGNSSSQSQIINVRDTTAPVLSGVPDEITVECDSVPSPATVTASDNCDAEPAIEYSQTGSLTCGNGVLIRTWTATDCAGNSSSQSQIINVQDTTAPILSGVPGEITVECNSIPSPATVGATDNCDSDPSIGYSQTGSLVCGNGTLVRTWTATDCAGNSSSQSQIINVQDTTAPVLSGVPGEITVECDSIPTPATVGATDNCDSDPSIGYSQTGSLVCGNGTLVRTWTATDCAGNSSSESQIVNVVDTTPPVLSNYPGDITVECDAIPLPPLITATDNCDSDPIVGPMVEISSIDPVCGTGIITRTWSATDCAGNTTQHTQTLTVVDTTPPTVIAPASQIFVCDACPDISTFPEPDPDEWATAFDNCDTGDLEIWFDPELEVIGPRNCNGDLLDECPKEIRRYWYAEDCSGNVGVALQRFTCLNSDEITDSSLCLFDREPCDTREQEFRVIFTPDVENQPMHMISSTNPGQFFYNVFYLGEPGEVVNMTICLPFPFVTKGANPVHIYDWVELEECNYGVGFVPGDLFYTGSQQVTLDDYIVNDELQDSVCSIDLEFTLPETGFAYVNLHLEYGVVHMGDFDQDIRFNAVDPRTKNIYLKHNKKHDFMTYLNNVALPGVPEPYGVSSAYNINDFQVSAGVTGRVVDSGGNGVTGAILLFEASNRRDGPVTFQVESDNGDYFIPYIHQGRPGTFKLTLTFEGETQERDVVLKNKKLAVEDFTVPAP